MRAISCLALDVAHSGDAFLKGVTAFFFLPFLHSLGLSLLE